MSKESAYTKNYGFLEDQIIFGKDYIFGGYGSLGGEVLMPDGNWKPYLPSGEKQFNNEFESMACTTFGTLNAVEILIRRIYGNVDNFSDRFLAKVSNTNVNGNSPHVVAEKLRKQGTPREELWPITKDLNSWETFYAPIPQSIQTVALEFTAKFDFKHEYVPTTPQALKEALKYSPLGISVSAWSKGIDGLYYSTFPNNHWCVLVGYKDGEYWEVYDSYDENGDFIKRLAWDYNFSVAKRYSITVQVQQTSHGWIAFLLSLFKAAFAPTVRDTSTVEVPTTQPVPIPESNREKLYQTALMWIGKEASPNDLAPDELGCAETLNEIYREAFNTYISNIPAHRLSTYWLYRDLKNASKFESIKEPLPGDIIISPTGYTYASSPIKNGHCGVVIEDGKILSNNSKSGLWTNTHTLESWKQYYGVKGGYPVLFFRCV